MTDVTKIVLEKTINIIFILAIACIFYRIINRLEKYIINKYIEPHSGLMYSRKINTQLAILKRVIIFLGFILTFFAIAMLFDSLKNFGIGLLTTAGIVSAVVVFAGQQSLSRLFAGLQLAFTQPIRIGDTIIVDNEFGQVQEITLSFITIKLWDLRRLILPTDYFTNKGVLNLSLDSSELLGTIFLYVDYIVPVDLIREHFLKLLEDSQHWNKKVGALEVTELKESTMEIRCLVSADDASLLWKLRCDVREKLIKYIVDNHYDCLAKTRNLYLSDTLFENAASGAYVFATQRLWYKNPGIDNVGISSFYQYGINNSAVLPFKKYVGMGLTGFGLISTRQHDSLGAGVALSWLNQQRFSRATELMYQAYYQAKLMQGIYLEPVISYVPTPGESNNLNSVWAGTLRLILLF